MKKQNRTPEERLLHAYEHAFRCLFIIALLAFTVFYLYFLGAFHRPQISAQSVGPWTTLSTWGLCAAALYKGLRLLFIHFSRPALGSDADHAYTKNLTL